MKFIVRGAACAAVLCLMGGSVRAADGVLIVQRTTTGSGTRTDQIQIAKDRIRVETTGATQVVIFDATKQVIDIVNADRKTYTEVTKAEIEQMQQMMSQMMANMPPAQRAQMEAMMAGRGMAGAAPAPVKTEYRKTGTDRVARWTCDKYDVYGDGQKASEVCTVSVAALGLSAADVDVMRQLGQFKQIASQVTAMFDLGQPNDPAFIGVPVRSIKTVAGQQVTIELTDVSHQTFADSLFEVPAGFQKEDMMRGRGRGPQ